MARRGFLSRFNPANILHSIAEAIERVFEGKREEEPRRAPSVKPSKRERREADPFERVWMEERLSRPNASYRRHRQLFFELPGIVEEDPGEQLDLWRDFLRTIDLKGRRRREFENTFGTNLKRDFDWDEWRRVMGYKGRWAA
jgi:hypothetical protein